jgi:hypothetical protein
MSGGAKPVAKFAAARGGDPVPLLRAPAYAVVGLDEPVPIEALQCRIHRLSGSANAAATAPGTVEVRGSRRRPSTAPGEQ